MNSFKLFIILTSLTSLNVQAALFGYCLADGESLTSAKSHLELVKSPQDRVYLRESVNCLEVKGSPKTFELYEKFLRQKFRVLRTYKDRDTGTSLNTQFQRGVCRIYITRIGKKNLVTENIKIGKKGEIVRSELKGNSKSISNLILTYGKRGSLTVNDQYIGLTCRKAGSGYQLKFDLEAGNSALSSHAFILEKQKLNIGGIVNDLNNKSRTLSINKGIDYKKEKGSEKFEYFLEVK